MVFKIDLLSSPLIYLNRFILADNLRNDIIFAMTWVFLVLLVIIIYNYLNVAISGKWGKMSNFQDFYSIIY